jgi:hypothetical protein
LKRKENKEEENISRPFYTAAGKGRSACAAPGCGGFSGKRARGGQWHKYLKVLHIKKVRPAKNGKSTILNAAIYVCETLQKLPAYLE